MRSLSKYFNTLTQNSFGEPLTWPGTMDGYPFVGPVPTNLKQEEYENIPLRLDAQVRVFWLPDDTAEYRTVKDRIVNGVYHQLKEVGPDWDDKKQAYRALLVWVEVAGCAPTRPHPHTRDAHAPIPERPERYLQDYFKDDR